eukprot:1011791-Pyramimonas_sp.AAC.4
MHKRRVYGLAGFTKDLPPSLPGRWRSGTTAPPLNRGRRFEPRRGRWRSEDWVLIPGGGCLAVERGAGG